MSGPEPGHTGVGSLVPIGAVECRERYPYEVPRQGALGAGNRATIRLMDDARRLGEATAGLAGFARIWVLSWFAAPYAGPWVRPPGKDEPRRGVFATRAPHRPNPIGLSCVSLVAVDGLVLEVADHDLLDGTPVLDLKPYLPYADAFPDVAAGWVDERVQRAYRVLPTDRAREQLDWLEREGRLAPWGFVRAQLSNDPDDASRKRVACVDPTGQRWTIAYRTWRIDFELDHAGAAVLVVGVSSGYGIEELAPGAPDPYGDKDVHRRFALAAFAP